MRLWGEVFSERGPTQEMDGGRKALALSLRLRLLGPDVKKKVTPGRKWGQVVETILEWCMCFGTNRRSSGPNSETYPLCNLGEVT